MPPNPAKIFFWLKLAAFAVVAAYAARSAWVRHTAAPNSSAARTNRTVSVTLDRPAPPTPGPGATP